MKTTHTLVTAIVATVALGGAAKAQTDADTTGICDGGYSMTDVDNNGYISPIEIEAYSERATTDMDADASGSISREEYVNCARKGMDVHPMREKGNLVDSGMIDADGDGMISSDEYLGYSADRAQLASEGDTQAADDAQRLVYRMPDESKLEFDSVPLEDVVSRSKRMFMVLDSNRDGNLSDEEYQTEIMKPIDIDDVLNREFDSMDADKSDDLTRDEMTQANTARAESAMQRSEAATGEKSDPEVGAPVVYYVYPHTM